MCVGVVGAAGALCDTGLNGGGTCYTDSGGGVECGCPLSTCREGDGDGGKCATSAIGIAIYCVGAAVFAVVVLLLSWVFCCKGPGCSTTPLFRGGVCCQQAPNEERDAPILWAKLLQEAQDTERMKRERKRSFSKGGVAEVKTPAPRTCLGDC